MLMRARNALRWLFIAGWTRITTSLAATPTRVLTKAQRKDSEVAFEAWRAAVRAFLGGRRAAARCVRRSCRRDGTLPRPRFRTTRPTT